MHSHRLRAGLVGTATLLMIVGTVAGAVPTVGEQPAVEGTIQADDPPEEAWNVTFGRSGNDTLKSVVPADDGYVLVGETNTAATGLDGWLIGVDDSGDRQFAATFGGPDDDRLSDAVRTEDGYLLAGWTTTDDRGTQGWLLKVDEQGVEQWSETFGRQQWDGFRAIDETADGNYVVVGRSHFEGWAMQIDGEGEVQWNRTYAGPGNSSTFTDFAEAGDGYTFAGWTDRENETRGGLAVRADESGSEQWNRSYGSNENTRIWGATSSDDGVLLAGETSGSDGQLRGWARIVDGDGDIESQWTDDEPESRLNDAIAVDDGFVLVGSANRTDAGFDAMAVGLDGDLEPQWEATTGGTQWDVTLSGVETEDGYLLGGATSSRGAGGLDGWLVKLESTNETEG